MLETFLSKGTLRKEDLLLNQNISDVSFKRYLATLRHYLFQYHPSWRIAYKKSESCYWLIKG
jgi:hypothetical protein